METKEISYNDALQELEAILRSIESGETDIDTLSQRVARATELIKLCRERLLKVEGEVRSALES